MNSVDFTNIGLFTSFLQGIFSFASPCVLPLLPVYFSYLSGGGEIGKNGEANFNRRKVIVNTLFFSLGIGATFFILGLGASAFGKFIAKNTTIFSIIGGLLIIAFGLLQLGLFGSNSFLQRERRLPLNMSKLQASPLAALLLGFVFSFAWTPCVGPALASILVLTSDAATRTNGMIYILFYTLGFALPFVITGFFVSSMLNFFRKHKGLVKWTARIGGLLMVGIGLFMTISGIVSIKKKQAAENASNKVMVSQKKRQAPPAPEFSLYDQYGVQWTLSELKGKAIILNFWATWCPPCRQEMPHFQSVFEEIMENPDSNVLILSVATPGLYREKEVPDIIKFLETNGYSYPCLMDHSGIVPEKYHISAFPTTYLINGNGEIQNVIVGGISEGRLKALVDEGLNSLN